MRPERTFRVLGTGPTLSADERREVEGEIARVRALLAGAPGRPLVWLGENPAGVLGEYGALLMDAAARGLPGEVLLPASVRRRYGARRWFAMSVEVLDAFSEQMLDRPVAGHHRRREPGRSLGRSILHLLGFATDDAGRDAGANGSPSS